MSEIIDTNTIEKVAEHSPDVEYDPQFKPIVSLPEVEVSLNEEHEEELLKIRAKLYRYDSRSDPAEWKERGTGELKLLRHKENNSVRIVMRRDKTLKICANHFITPWIELQKHSSSDRAFVYTVPADFADEITKSECLAVKFGNLENANIFKTKFEEAKSILTKDCCLYNGECDEDNEENGEDEEEKENLDLSQKLSELDVNKKEEKLK